MKQLGIGTVLILMLLMCAIFPMAATDEPRVALVIGNSEYKYASLLTNPVNDATDVGMALRSIGFDTTIVLDADIGEMEDKVLTFTEKLRRDPESAGIFYYAGHAVQSSGINYLLPIDANIHNEYELRRKALSAQEILDYISEAHNSFNMVVLDACRDNPFAGSFRSTQRGLAGTAAAPPETLVVYATDAGNVATDGEGRNSPFTEAFLANVTQPGIDVEIMVRNVMAEVQQKTNQQQRPWKYSSLTSAFQLVPKVTDDLKPVLVATEYTVIFDTQGGVASEPLNKKVPFNSNYGTLPEVRRIGYTFEGWWTGKGGTGTQINAQTMMTRTEDHFLYAKWIKVSYTITYYLDGGTNSISNPATYTIESPTINLQNPKRIGYRFSGWYADDSFAVEVTEIPSSSSGTKNLYAKWVKVGDMWWIATVEPEVIATVDDPEVIVIVEDMKGIEHKIRVESEVIVDDPVVIETVAQVEIVITDPKAIVKTPISSFTYTTINNNEIKITDFIGSETEVIIPDNIKGKPVTSIGDHAFGWSGSSITSITIPDSIITIGDSAFSECTSLTDITIPSNVTSIGGSAFYSCYNLTSINVDVSNTSYVSVDGVLFDYSKTTIITVPAGFETEIYDIPTSVTTIGEYAFARCTNLTDITIPGNVASIGDSAFSNCTSLTSINVDVSNTSYVSVDGVLFDYSKTTIITFPAGFETEIYDIPTSVTTIGERAFSGCWRLTSITIPNSVTMIGDSAFNHCYNLTDITIPDSVISIGVSAFLYCRILTSITIPDSVTSIGNLAFFYCESLTSITIPDSVTSIGHSVFMSSDSLTDIYCEASSKPAGWDSDWDNGCSATVTWGYTDEVESKSPELESDSVVSSEKSNQSSQAIESAPSIIIMEEPANIKTSNLDSEKSNQSPWAIEFALSTVGSLNNFVGFGGYISVQLRFSDFFASGLWGGVIVSDAVPLFGVKFIFGEQNSYKISLNAGFPPSIGLYISDFYIEYVPWFLVTGPGYHGLSIGYVLNF